MSARREGLPAFNHASPEEARDRLLGCLDVPRWAEEVAARRPFDDLGQVDTAMRESAATITDAELERALARHPRIGERADAAVHDAAHSAREQAGVDPADAALAEELRECNAAYEERFDRVFLIRAAGRDGREILRELRRRLGNDDAAERAETLEQLTQIALLRIREVLS